MKFNYGNIPENEKKMIALTFLDAIRKFYSDPKNVEKFKEWQKHRHADSILVSA